MRAEVPQRFTASPFVEQSEGEEEVCHENRMQGTRGFDADLCRAGLLLLRWSRRQLLDGPLAGSESCTDSHNAQHGHEVACRTRNDHTRWHNDATGIHDAIRPGSLVSPFEMRSSTRGNETRKWYEKSLPCPSILNGASAFSPFWPRRSFRCVGGFLFGARDVEAILSYGEN